jgi:Fur family ferric uptake transcriptional regulator
MTTAALTRPLVAPDVEAATTVLREAGHRVTAARRIVIEALYAADAPVTAEEVAEGLGGRLPRTDVTSVYRSLELLEQLGLVSHVHLGHGPGRYARASRERREYVICDRCGAYEEVDPGRLDGVREAVRAAFGYEASFTHFPIVGLCPDCVGSEGRHAHP